VFKIFALRDSLSAGTVSARRTWRIALLDPHAPRTTQSSALMDLVSPTEDHAMSPFIALLTLPTSVLITNADAPLKNAPLLSLALLNSQLSALTVHAALLLITVSTLW
jgi:hypothetical protein